MKSIFNQIAKTPSNEALKKALGETYALWQLLAIYIKKVNPDVVESWNYTSEKYGWSFRISDKKRVIMYLLPREHYFKAAFVFGQKASDIIFESNVSELIKIELRLAKVYAEGRGIRIEVKDKTIIKDIKKLIEIKIAN